MCFTRKNTALLIYCVFCERLSCWSLIHTMEYKNIMSMEFPMSENILLDTLIILISAILAKIEGFYFSYFAEKIRHKTSISKNAQWCQLCTLQNLILHGLMISNQSKTIVGPLTHGYLKLLPD